MFCKNCGNQMPDGAKFCNKCGFVVGSPTGQNAPQMNNQGSGTPVPPLQYNGAYQAPQGNNGGNRNKIIVLIIIIVAVLVGGIVAMKVIGIGPFEKTQVTETDDRDEDEKDRDEDEKDKDDDDDDN